LANLVVFFYVNHTDVILAYYIDQLTKHCWQ